MVLVNVLVPVLDRDVDWVDEADDVPVVPRVLEPLELAVELTVVLCVVTSDIVTEVLTVVENDELSVEDAVLDRVKLPVTLFVVVAVVVSDVRSQAWNNPSLRFKIAALNLAESCSQCELTMCPPTTHRIAELDSPSRSNPSSWIDSAAALAESSHSVVSNMKPSLRGTHPTSWVTSEQSSSSKESCLA